MISTDKALDIAKADEEYWAIVKEWRGCGECSDNCHRIARAQLKKFIEWGDETCTDRSHSGTMKKRECGFCWQALLREVI